MMAKKANEMIKRSAEMGPGKARNDLVSMINSPQMVKQFKNAVLGTAMTPERFVRIATTLAQNPKMAECTTTSVLAALMQAAQLGLEPNTSMGYAYLIPYRNHGVMECQFQIGYQGMIELAKRSGLRVTARVVCENDEFSYQYGWDDDLRHIPAKGDRGKPAYYYAKYKDKEGFGDFVVLSYEDVLRHAKRFSKSFNSGPWKSDFDSMAMKTAIKQVLKYAPLSVEFKSAINYDEGFKNIEIEDLENGVDVIDVPAEFAEPEEPEEVINEETGEIEKLQGELVQEDIFKA